MTYEQQQYAEDDPIFNHKRRIEVNENYINSFVQKHIGNPRKLGRALFNYEMKLLRRAHEELGTPESSDASYAIRALSHTSYAVGMYSVDNVNTMPYGTCVKVMFGAFLACAEMHQAALHQWEESVITEARQINEEHAREVFERLLQQQEEDDGPEYDTGSGWVDPE